MVVIFKLFKHGAHVVRALSPYLHRPSSCCSGARWSDGGPLEEDRKGEVDGAGGNVGRCNNPDRCEILERMISAPCSRSTAASDFAVGGTALLVRLRV